MNIRKKHNLLQTEGAGVIKALLVDVDRCQRWSLLSSYLWSARGHQPCAHNNQRLHSRLINEHDDSNKAERSRIGPVWRMNSDDDHTWTKIILWKHHLLYSAPPFTDGLPYSHSDATHQLQNTLAVPLLRRLQLLCTHTNNLQDTVMNLTHGLHPCF